LEAVVAQVVIAKSNFVIAKFIYQLLGMVTFVSRRSQIVRELSFRWYARRNALEFPTTLLCISLSYVWESV
jgi:hypothetical protein